jgi:hypothetical protein
MCVMQGRQVVKWACEVHLLLLGSAGRCCVSAPAATAAAAAAALRALRRRCLQPLLLLLRELGLLRSRFLVGGLEAGRDAADALAPALHRRREGLRTCQNRLNGPFLFLPCTAPDSPRRSILSHCMTHA